MQWKDEGFLLSKNKYGENSIIIEVFTLNHGKCSGMVYGGTSKKIKNYLQLGNKIHVNLKTKNDSKLGYFKIEIIDAISPFFFDDTATTEIYTLSLHDALPISIQAANLRCPANIVIYRDPRPMTIEKF